MARSFDVSLPSAMPAELLRFAGGVLRGHDVDQGGAAEVHRLVEGTAQVAWVESCVKADEGDGAIFNALRHWRSRIEVALERASVNAGLLKSALSLERMRSRSRPASWCSGSITKGATEARQSLTAVAVSL